MKKRTILFDCDPGHDDAIALVMALACKSLDIRAITIVGGNHSLDKVGRNALQILEVCGRTDIPVALGRSQPFLQKLILAEKFHGKSGMDGHNLPQPLSKPVKEHAVELMAQTLEQSEDPVTLIVTGPFTNIATLLLCYPHLHHKIGSISAMGGSYYRGNWSAIAEFNVWIDPEAADILMRSGIPFLLHGLDVTHQAYITRQEQTALRGMQNPVADFVADLFEFFSKSCIDFRGHPGCLVHDACAVAGLIDPSLFRYEDSVIEMDLDGRHTRGGCLIDTRPDAWHQRRRTHGKVAAWCDRERFVTLLLESCRAFGAAGNKGAQR